MDLDSALPPVALPILTVSAQLSFVSAMETLVKARAKLFGVLSIVVVARTLHLLLVGLLFTPRCSKPRVLALTATPTTMLPALSLAPAETIR